MSGQIVEMDWLGWTTAIAAVVGAAAALGGLVGVFVQLRSLNTQIGLQTYAEYTKRYADVIQRFPENVNSAAFEMASLGSNDRDRLMRAMRSYFDLCFEEWDLNEKKLISPDFWMTWQEGMQTALSKPAFRQAWEVIQGDSVFGTKFEKFIADLSVKQ
jgi:hypothetical protein